jgi:hypothetical protein
VLVQLLCDHKWRDLPNLVATKIALEELGHRVIMTSTKDVLPAVAAFSPDCVVFNHLRGDLYRNLALDLRRQGSKVVLLPTEGTTHPFGLPLMSGRQNHYDVADLILNWSDEVSGLIKSEWNLDDQIVQTAGCTRFDFYDARFRGVVTSRDAFCSRYGLDASRPIVTVATKYVFAHLAEPSPLRDKFLRESENFGLRQFYGGLGVELGDVPRLEAEGREAAQKSFFGLAASMPEVQFVLKPHPSENREYYRARIQELGLSNFHFCPRDYIWNVLNASDVHLHRYCTTAVEAWMWNKPTIELGMDHVPELAWPEREQGSDVARSARDLTDLVSGYLKQERDTRHLQHYRKHYIHRWFGPADGTRCASVAGSIDKLMRQSDANRPRRLSLKASARSQIAAVGRFVLGRKAGESLFGPKAVAGLSGPEDKVITRLDVSSYQRSLQRASGGFIRQSVRDIKVG